MIRKKRKTKILVKNKIRNKTNRRKMRNHQKINKKRKSQKIKKFKKKINNQKITKNKIKNLGMIKKMEKVR